MENSDEYIDVDSNEVHSTDDDTAGVKLNDEEDDIYSVSSGSESSNDSDDADKGNDDKPVEVDAVVGDRVVNVNSITSDEIFALEFGTVDEAFEFYYRYGKCKGFAARKSDRRKDPKGSKKLVMRQFVCNKHGYRDKKHLCKTDRKREHRRLTRTGCTARLRVQYKPKKDRYVVSIFEKGHNHELTPSKYVHLHPIYRQISEADRAQIDGLQSHGFRTCHIMGYMVAVKGRGAPKKRKTDTKTIRRGGRCDNTTHNARSCSHAKQAPVGKNVKLDSVSLTDSVSQTEKNKKRKTSCKGEPSVQQMCSDGPQNCGDNATMRQIPSMYAVQPMMPMIHPGGHPMQVQPVYPIYGVPVGGNSNSCFGLLQQVMKSAGKE